MSEINQNPMPKFDILPHPLRKLGRGILGLLRMPHQLASHGDHDFKHPLDDVFDGEAYTDHDVLDNLNNMNQMILPYE